MFFGFFPIAAPRAFCSKESKTFDRALYAATLTLSMSGTTIPFSKTFTSNEWYSAIVLIISKASIFSALFSGNKKRCSPLFADLNSSRVLRLLGIEQDVSPFEQSSQHASCGTAAEDIAS